MIDKKRKKLLEELLQKLGLSFRELQTCDIALTHKSYTNENSLDSAYQNERLEFLGDAVLNLVISDYVYGRFSDREEGDLAKMKSVLVSSPVLASIAKKVQIGAYLRMGKGEEKTGGRFRSSNLTNAVESIIGALYIDAGIDSAREFIIRTFSAEMEKIFREDYVCDYKSLFQEYTQRNFRSVPEYRKTAEKGPQHKKTFEVEVCVNRERAGLGHGRSKKEAEQVAAKEALKKYKVLK